MITPAQKVEKQTEETDDTPVTTNGQRLVLTNLCSCKLHGCGVCTRPREPGSDYCSQCSSGRCG